MRVHTQLTVNYYDSEIAYRVDDYNHGGQQQDISDGDLCYLLTSAQPHHLGLECIQSQSAGLHPFVDICDARSQASNGSSGVNMGTLGILELLLAEKYAYV